MLDFVFLVSRFFVNIFGLLGDTLLPFGTGFNDTVSLGGILFVCLVLGFVVSIFWKGAKSQ